MEAAMLCVHSLRMAAMYFEAVEDEASLLEEIDDQMDYDVAKDAARAWLTNIQEFYRKIEERIDAHLTDE
jgi:hypothetical protein